MLKSLTPPITPANDKVKVRTDKNGIEINKNNKKKVHITFLDDIPPNKITDTINIQSFKQYNIIEKMPGEDDANPNKCRLFIFYFINSNKVKKFFFIMIIG